MQDPDLPFWETGKHPITWIKEHVKMQTEEQKEMARIARKKRNKKQKQ